MNIIVIIMAGMIGVGKTTYTQKLADALGTDPFYEPVDDNPILDKYYEDPDKYGFALQIYFLNKRFGLIKQAYKENNNVLDRSIYEDALFTKVNVDNGNISMEEYGIYLDLLDNMMEEIDGLPKKAPDLMIFLDGGFEHIMQNIQKRGRSFEQPSENNDLYDYYKQLWSEYREWYEAYDKGPKMIVHTDDYDIHNPDDWAAVYRQIKAHMSQLGLSSNTSKEAIA